MAVYQVSAGRAYLAAHIEYGDLSPDDLARADLDELVTAIDAVFEDESGREDKDERRHELPEQEKQEWLLKPQP